MTVAQPLGFGVLVGVDEESCSASTGASFLPLVQWPERGWQVAGDRVLQLVCQRRP